MKQARQEPDNPPEDDLLEYDSRWGTIRDLVNCRTILYMCLVVLALAMLLVGYTIIQKPPSLWEPFKHLVNGGLNQEIVDLQEIYTSFDPSQFEYPELHPGELVFTEQEMAAIIVNETQTEAFVDIDPDRLEIYIDLEQQPDTEPLWAKITVVTDPATNDPKVEQIRTGIVSTPSFLNDLATQLLRSALSHQSNEEQTSERSLIGTLLGLATSVKVDSIQLRADNVLITLTPFEISDLVTL